MATIKMVIKLRRDTTENWLLNKDIIPEAGEPCFDLDLNTLKVGDGVTTYGNLKPISGAEVAVDGKSIILNDGAFKLAGFDAAEVGAQPRKNADGNLEWFIPSTEEIDILKANVKDLQDDVSDIKDAIWDGTEPLLTRVESLEHKMDGTGEGSVDKKIDAKINEFANKFTDDGTVNTLKELVDYVANHGGELETLVSDITTLQELVGEDPVFKQIENAISGIDTGDKNVIESISIDGTLLGVVEKSVNIPVASLNGAGVVKSSTGVNKVNISNNGEMSVNKVSIGSLVVPIGEEFILDGGAAHKYIPVYSTTIGNIGYDSIADAVNHADNGDVVTLQEDAVMGTGDNDHLVVNTENVTINLGEKTLVANGSNGAIKVEGGITTLDGTGTVSGTLGSDNYSMAVWASNGTVVINDGIYTNMTDGSDRGTDLIYASGTGCIEINGGIFEAAKPEWTLNVKDADYKAGTAKIIVKGGSFKGFDPANNNAEGVGTNFVADGYKSVLEGEYYVVKPI